MNRRRPVNEEDVPFRLDAVEKRCKVLQRRLNFAGFGFLVILTAFVVSAWIPRSQAAQDSGVKADVLRVHQLIVVDEKGIDRIVIGPIPNPQVRGTRMKRRSPAMGVEVNDSQGNERVGLAILDDGSTVVGMDDELGQERAHLYYIPKKGAGLLIHGENEKETISLSIPPKTQSSRPILQLTDKAGNPVAVVPEKK
jgi:hypothetical protein